jgi:hypothetical protein
MAKDTSAARAGGKERAMNRGVKNAKNGLQFLNEKYNQGLKAQMKQEKTRAAAKKATAAKPKKK